MSSVQQKSAREHHLAAAQVPLTVFDAQASDMGLQFAEVYRRLKILANRQRSRTGLSTLCTTELVHEALLKMGDAEYKHEGDLQFFAYAAQAIRHILTDAARRRIQPKRGGDQVRVPMEDPAVESVHVNPELALQLDAALKALEEEHKRAAQVVELHFFAGLDLQQVADTLQVTRRTINRDWRYARAFLATYAQA